MAGIYLDYNASTPIAPEVQAAMLPLLETAYGNPSIGVPEQIGMGAVRFSLGRGTTQAEIDAVTERLRALSL